MKFMIVDDDPRFRALIRQIVVKSGDSVVEYSSGEHVVENYRKSRPDWVLMDLQMETVNGLKATRQLLDCHPEANVAIITDNDDHFFREQILSTGARTFVTKDNLGELESIIRPAGMNSGDATGDELCST